MFSSLHSPTLSASFARGAFAALMGSAFLATPGIATATRAPAQATAATTGVPVAATAIETKGGALGRRIININTGG